MNTEIRGKASDFERLHAIAVRKHGCMLVRRDNHQFRAIVPERATGLTSEIRREINSLRGVEVAA